MAKTKHKNCDCIFCNSKCPECKSTRVEVKFIIECGYSNFEEDLLSIHQDIVGVLLQCNECGEEVRDSIDFWEDNYEFNFDGSDERLEAITKALVRVYPNLREFNYEGDGKIDDQEYNVIARGQSWE